MPTVQFASPLVTCPPKSHRLLSRFCRYRHLLFLSPRILVFPFHRHRGCLCSVKSLSQVQLFATPWTAAHQASLSITNSWSLLKHMSISWWCNVIISSSVDPFLSCVQSFPASGSFPISKFLSSGGQSIGTLASASVLPMNIQDWFPFSWLVWSPCSPGNSSRVFSNTTVTQ